jgi:16S rRNA (adenine1518-N6/adenine1519-N6)-dimethyltransferase
VTNPREPAALPRARRRFAQHFLTDRRVLRRIVETLAPDSSSTVLEIGAGRGALTDLVAPLAHRTIAIEVDRDLAAFLRARYAGVGNVEVVAADALKLDWGALTGSPYLLAGNLPYNLTTPFIFKALTRPLPQRIVFLVQREVAERIVAPPGNKEYGALSVNVRTSTHAEIVARVSPGSFQPPPTVDSSILLLVPLQTPLLESGEVEPFRRFVQSVFGMRRKQLIRVVREVEAVSADRAAAILGSVGIPPGARPEMLRPEEFVSLYRARGASGGA